jgi:PAS domain S-box-containing protein
VLAWNPAAVQLFGWTREEAVGHVVPFVGPEVTEEFRSLVEDVRAGGVYSGFETVRRRKDGSPIDVSVSAAPVRGSSGAVVSHMALFADITERKRREEEIEIERDFLDTLGETVPSMLVLVDREGVVQRDGLNRACRETLGRDSEQAAGRSFLQLVHPDDDFQTRMAIGAAANGVERSDVENRWLRSDGEAVVVAWSATPITHPRAGELVLISGVDVTDRQRQEEEIRASRARIVQAADAARRRLERNLHDGAQQRLVSLSLSLRLAEAKLDGDGPGARQLLAAAREELALAIDELRELARGIHPAVLTDRGLSAAVEALVGRCPVPVEWDVLEERLPPAVEAAAYYVVSEALANVAKYAEATSAAVRIAGTDEVVSVEVADDGVGGADASAGSGLRGLVDRVAALDGTLRVESPPGGGTRIVAEIPVREPALAK